MLYKNNKISKTYSKKAMEIIIEGNEKSKNLVKEP